MARRAGDISPAIVDMGMILDALGGKNIVSSSPVEDATRIDFSVEQVVARNPDVTLTKTMGDIEACRARIEKEITASDAGKGIAAVRNGCVHADARYAEASEFLAKLQYPEVFGAVE